MSDTLLRRGSATSGGYISGNCYCGSISSNACGAMSGSYLSQQHLRCILVGWHSGHEFGRSALLGTHLVFTHSNDQVARVSPLCLAGSMIFCSLLDLCDHGVHVWLYTRWLCGWNSGHIRGLAVKSRTLRSRTLVWRPTITLSHHALQRQYSTTMLAPSQIYFGVECSL